MDLMHYQNFINSHPNLVNNYVKKCHQEVFFNCVELKKSKRNLYHGTRDENAKNILREGFKIDNFSGTKGMGVGIYLTPDINLAKYFGTKLLEVQTNIKSSLGFTFESLQKFKETGSEFFEKTLEIISKNPTKYIDTPENLESNISQKSQTPNIAGLAKIKNKDVTSLAQEYIFKEAAALINANVFTNALQKTSYTSIHTPDDIYGGILGRPMNQWIITDLNEIKSIKPIE